MKVLFYGGAFNPVTRAHIELANYVRQTINYDKVLFMPTQDQYIKHDEGKDFVINSTKRKALLDLVASQNDWMIVSDYELSLTKQPRTYETLCYLRDEGYELKLLMGSDWLPKLKTGWKYVDEIMHEFGVVMMTRNHDDIESMIEKDTYLRTYKEYITCVSTPDIYQHISSTKMRQLMFNKEYSNDLFIKSLPKEITVDSFKNIIEGEEND